MSTGLEGLALGAWTAMWKLYDRKYGKHGEARVKALQAQIVKLQRTIDRHVITLKAAEEMVRVLEQDLDDADREIARLKNRLNEAEMRSDVGPVPDSPFTVPADGATVGAMVPDEEVPR